MENIKQIVPLRLLEIDQWIGWKKRNKADGTIDKIPISINTGRQCDVTDPKNYSSFDGVLAYRQRYPQEVDGQGICLSKSINITGLDLDKAFSKDNTLKAWAAEILAILPPGTYVEISPSGQGLRAFLGGNKKGTKCKKTLPDGGKIELYDCKRFLTVTGNRYGEGSGVVAAQEVIHRLEDEWLNKVADHETSATAIQPSHNLQDEDLLAKIFASEKGEEIKMLWNGNIDKYLEDDSAADQALLCHLAFWTAKNPEQMERLFSGSVLGARDKWRNRKDYRQLSIQTAIKVVTETYSPAKTTKDDHDHLLNNFELATITESIQLIDPKTSKKELPLKLKNIMDKLSTINEAQSMAILKEEVKKHFGLVDNELNLYVKQVKQERKRVLTESAEKSLSAKQALGHLDSANNDKIIHPAIDFVDGVMYFAVKIKGQLFLVSSKRKLLGEGSGLNFKHKNVDYSLFSPQVVKRFLEGEADDPMDLFFDIKAYINRFVYFTDKRHLDLLAVWIMGTYLFPIFHHYPYLWFNADKGSGKTTTFEVTFPICFNGQMVVSPTPAVLFRDVSANRVTLLIDEFEQMAQQDQDVSKALFDILNAGYNREGQVKRVEKGANGEYTIKNFSAYSPKAFSGINSIYHVLRDRTIAIRMLKKGRHDEHQRYKATPEILELQRHLRDRCYIFALSYADEIAKIYHTGQIESGYLSHLNNRELDLWEPLIAILCAIDEDRLFGLVSPLIKLSKQSFEEKSADNLDDDDTGKIILKLKHLLESKVEFKMVMEEGKSLQAYRAADVISFLDESTEGIEVFFNQAELSKRMKKLHIIAKQRRWDDERPVTYAFSSEQILELADRFNVYNY